MSSQKCRDWIVLAAMILPCDIFKQLADKRKAQALHRLMRAEGDRDYG